MKTSEQRDLPSLPMVGSVLIALGTLYITYDSALALVLATLFGASFLLPYRLERDSANIWVLRLAVFAGIAVLGRSPVAAPDYLFDARAFATAGLLAGGEIVLTSWRKAPPHTRFDPSIILLTGIIFLVASNTFRSHIWVLAPLYMFLTLLALGEIKDRPPSRNLGALARRSALLAFAIALGFMSHQLLWANRGNIMAMGARLLFDRRTVNPTPGVGDTSTLTSGTFGAAQSASRLMSIRGNLKDQHLRGTSFTQYNRGTWGPPISSRKLTAARDGEMNGTMRGPFTNITLLRDVSGLVFFPLNARAIMPANGSSLDWDRFSGPVKTDEKAPYTYHFIEDRLWADELLPPLHQGPLCVAPRQATDSNAYADLLQVPEEIDPAVKELAVDITLEASTPAEKAAAITEYLLSNHKYSLNYVRGPGDPVSDFLLNKKPAHCQYFASSAVILMRMAGVPSRYASGYYAYEEDSSGGIVVRQRDAHAWAEAYIQGIGWVVVEATPPSGRADPNVAPLLWYQKSLEALQDNLGRLRLWLGGLTQLQILGMMGLIAALWGLERWRVARKNRKNWAGPIPPEELIPLVRKFEKLLVRRGITVTPAQTWSENLPVDWPAGQEFVQQYNRVRFRSISLEELQKLQAALDAAHQRDTTPTAR